MKNYDYVPDRPNSDHPDVCGEDREPEETEDSVRSSASAEASTQRDNFPVPVLASPTEAHGLSHKLKSEPRESTNDKGMALEANIQLAPKSDSRGGETNLSGGSDAGDVRWQSESKSQDLCNPYRAETQAAPAQNIPPDADNRGPMMKGYEDYTCGYCGHKGHWSPDCQLKADHEGLEVALPTSKDTLGFSINP